jgi:uncharacterized protein (DUF433 family)
MTTPIYNEKIIKIYGSDPREIPIYGLNETARYLKLHVNTLRSWVYGRTYFAQNEQKKSLPVIHLPDKNKPLLSFMNLVEVHVLSAITRVHKVKFKKVRNTLRTLERLKKDLNDKHPLATNEFWVDGFDIFVEESGDYFCASRDGQNVFKAVIEQHLHRVDRDIDFKALRIYPFPKLEIVKKASVLEKTPKNISIDPLISFGRPTITGTGIATNVIAGRFGAGEKIEALAKDYEIAEEKIKEALDYEGISRKAA